MDRMTSKEFREAMRRQHFEIGWQQYRVAMICIALAALLVRLAFYARHW